jgi:hypothetical protein
MDVVIMFMKCTLLKIIAAFRANDYHNNYRTIAWALSYSHSSNDLVGFTPQYKWFIRRLISMQNSPLPPVVDTDPKRCLASIRCKSHLSSFSNYSLSSVLMRHTNAQPPFPRQRILPPDGMDGGDEKVVLQVATDRASTEQVLVQIACR